MNARTGKIARLPVVIREELNRRLLDGESGLKILPWLNECAETKAVIEADFQGLKVTDKNLSDWRAGGYQDWLKQRERTERTKELASYAAKQSRADGGTLAAGAHAIVAGQLLEALEAVDAASGARLPAEALGEITKAVVSLRVADQNDVRLRMGAADLKRKQRELELNEQRFQRETCRLFIEWSADARARELAESGGVAMEEKIRRLKEMMFPEDKAES